MTTLEDAFREGARWREAQNHNGIVSDRYLLSRNPYVGVQQPPTREQIVKYEALLAEWRTESLDVEMGRYRAVNYGHLLADSLSEVLALFPQPTPSAEAEESGVCHCGTDMDAHTWTDGHNPVDMGVPPADERWVAI